MGTTEEEIYSIMFTSLKHPVRRKILRMLAEKSLTFMEMVEQVGVSTSHLTYHLESLGELVVKLDNGKYKLSTFGLATVSAMKGVEEAPKAERQHALKLPFRWKTLLGVLLVAVIVLAAMSTVQYYSLNQVSSSQAQLAAENKQLLSWGTGTNKVANLLSNVTQIDTTQYTITLLSNTLEYRTDFGVTEENLKYSLTSPASNLDIDLRFRANHLSLYTLKMIESSPIFSQPQPNDLLQIAQQSLNRYRTYSGDDYLNQMSALLSTVSKVENLELTQGNIKLQILMSSNNAVQFTWMYTQDGVDFSAKSLRMTFQNNILTEISDGYFLFTVANAKMSINHDQAFTIAKNYAKTYTWDYQGQKITGFSTLDTPVSVQFVPHPRGNSVALVPYWYIILQLDKVYAGGINEITVGIYADNGEVDEVQMLSGVNTAT